MIARRGRALIVIVVCVLAAMSCGSDEQAFPEYSAVPAERTPMAADFSEVDLRGSAPTHDGNFSWSLVEPLTRETVGLPPVDETDQDTFAYSLLHPELLNVELELADGPFVQQPRSASGSLSRIEGVRHDLTLVTDGQTLDEAEAELLGYVSRFDFDPVRIAEWKQDAEVYFEGDGRLRQTLNLRATTIGDVRVSASAAANPATNDVLIAWHFSWPS